MMMGFVVLDENNNIRLFASELGVACWVAKDLESRGLRPRVEFYTDAL